MSNYLYLTSVKKIVPTTDYRRPRPYRDHRDAICLQLQRIAQCTNVLIYSILLLKKCINFNNNMFRILIMIDLFLVLFSVHSGY